MTISPIIPLKVIPSLLPINMDAIPELIDRLTKSGPTKPRILPLQFESPSERANLIAIQALLDSIDLSIYAKDIVRLCDRSASELILCTQYLLTSSRSHSATYKWSQA